MRSTTTAVTQATVPSLPDGTDVASKSGNPVATPREKLMAPMIDYHDFRKMDFA